MTLVNCEQCNEDISDSVEVCPHCGYKETDWTDSAKAAEFRKMTHDWRKKVGFKWRHFISDQFILWGSAAVIVFFLLWLWSRYLNGS